MTQKTRKLAGQRHRSGGGARDLPPIPEARLRIQAEDLSGTDSDRSKRKAEPNRSQDGGRCLFSRCTVQHPPEPDLSGGNRATRGRSIPASTKQSYRANFGNGCRHGCKLTTTPTRTTRGRLCQACWSVSFTTTEATGSRLPMRSRTAKGTDTTSPKLRSGILEVVAEVLSEFRRGKLSGWSARGYGHYWDHPTR